MLPEINSAGYSPEQIMMTLAAITYSGTTQAQIETELANTNYATQGEWQLVWGPVNTVDDTNVDNLMYIAQYAKSNMYAVAIRGTVLSAGLNTLFDIYEDLEVSYPLPWTYPSVDGALVAGGTLFGLDILTLMKDNATGQTIVDFFSSVPPAFIYVTGHSLGGCLTTVLAPWLKYQFEENSINQQYILPYTFAAPTAGNQSFADWYNQQFTLLFNRYYNEIDVIPMAWDNMDGIKSLFPGGPVCPWTMRDAINLIVDWLNACGVSYAQTNGAGVSLTGKSTQNSDWFTEMGIQHWHNTYLALLEAPLVGATSFPLRYKRYHPALLQPAGPVSNDLGSVIRLE